MSDVLLNFINKSDTPRANVVIFQKNAALPFNEIATAWRVIRNCGRGDQHPFSFPQVNTISASDAWGNFVPQMTANNGQMFEVAETSEGEVLRYAGPSVLPGEIQFRSNIKKGSLNAWIYRDGKVLSSITNVVPGQRVSFRFKPSIWIGFVKDVEEGELMSSAILSTINTEISLLGIRSGSIIMTGGGEGRDARPVQFNLANVVMV